MKLILLLMILLFCATPVEARFKCSAPKPTTEFEKMSYAPVYPTYSWEPVANAEFYQVQVLNERNEIVSDLQNLESLSRLTDWQPFIKAGKYYWRVRAIDENKSPISDWSEQKFFEVKMPVEIAALGDSITHGGADFIPSGQLSCQWETYCDIPIKNIGRSGDTTAMMIERFDNDVLPFQPRILIIMGGVNDIREGKTAAEVILNLEVLRDKCLANNITPIFGTITPMNEKIIRSRGINLTKNNWKAEISRVNDWILKRGGIDISSGLYDNIGELRAEITPDGLHPDLRGKMFIGKAIEKYLEAKNLVRADG